MPLLKKEKGGSGILWRGVEYSWPEDGSVTEVPDDLAGDLLRIPGEGFSVVADKPKAAETFSEVDPAAETPRRGGRKPAAAVEE